MHKTVKGHPFHGTFIFQLSCINYISVSGPSSLSSFICNLSTSGCFLINMDVIFFFVYGCHQYIYEKATQLTRDKNIYNNQFADWTTINYFYTHAKTSNMSARREISDLLLPYNQMSTKKSKGNYFSFLKLKHFLHWPPHLFPREIPLCTSLYLSYDKKNPAVLFLNVLMSRTLIYSKTYPENFLPLCLYCLCVQLSDVEYGFVVTAVKNYSTTTLLGQQNYGVSHNMQFATKQQM